MTPAYNPLIAISARLAHTDPKRAAALLNALKKANPTRSEAGKMLEILNRDF